MWHSVDNHPGVPLIFFSIPLPLGPDTLAAPAATVASDFQFCFTDSGVCLALHESPIMMAQPGNTLKAVNSSSYRTDLISQELLIVPCLMPNILFQILYV